MPNFHLTKVGISILSRERPEILLFSMPLDSEIIIQVDLTTFLQLVDVGLQVRTMLNSDIHYTWVQEVLFTLSITSTIVSAGLFAAQRRRNGGVL